MIHGAIDGYSRLVTFLRCSTNNRSETVLGDFVKATQEYGLPSRVRTDHGGEYVRVWEFMEEQREILISPVRVFITLELKDCGEMFTGQCHLLMLPFL